MHTLSLPIFIDLPRKKKKDRFYLNLNQYRNTHYFTLNKAKELFKESVTKAIETLPKMAKVELIFTLFMGSNRSADLSNICSVVDKFFCDAMVELGKLPGDDFDVISSVGYRFGGVDKNNPRVDVSINPLVNAEEEEKMQITIVQAEMETAIRNYIKSQITVNEDMDINIELRATRGAEGFQAIIDIVPAEVKPVGSRKAANTVTAPATTKVVEPVQEEAQAPVEETVAETRNIDTDADAPPIASKSLFGGLKSNAE